MSKAAIAIGCHPDDIEFMMAGTLIQLKKAGYEIHYMNIANGSLGTDHLSYEEITAMRRNESMSAAKIIGATYHESICDDIEVFYTYDNVCKVTEVIREVNPEIVLTHGPYDYMEDHVNSGRIAVSAAFCRGMNNLKCGQKFPITLKEVAVYHSMPHSLHDQLRNPVIPEIYIDVEDVMDLKKDMLRCHKSQKEWLDVSQGNDAYIEELIYRGEYYGKLSKKFNFAEGWIRHSNVGFGREEYNPLVDALTNVFNPKNPPIQRQA